MKMQFVKQDCWIGLYWKTVKSEPTCHCGDLLKNHGYSSNHSFTEIVELNATETTWYLCFIPCFPIIWKTYK